MGLLDYFFDIVSTFIWEIFYVDFDRPASTL
jgi:hypothetical protein